MLGMQWILVSLCLAQNDSINLLKYNNLRERLLTRFVKVGSGHGESLPADRWIIGAADEANPQSQIFKKLDFGADVTINHGWYLGVLATECYLAKRDSTVADSTARELYLALEAINRLDDYAELIWAYAPNSICDDTEFFNYPVPWDSATQTWIPKTGSTWDTLFRNGFIMRMDGHHSLLSYFTDADVINAVMSRPWNPATRQWDPYALNPDKVTYTTAGYRRSNEQSQDQIIHLLMGLTLTVEFAQSITWNQENLSEKAREIALRLLNYYTPGWTFTNPVTQRICNGGQNSFFYAPSLALLKKSLERGEKNQKNGQTYLWYNTSQPCNKVEKLYQVAKHMYACISAISNSTPHKSMCRYVTKQRGFDWGFYYLLRKALYPHTASTACDYTEEAVKEDLNACPFRGPHWDVYLYAEDGSYMHSGEFIRNTGDPNDARYKPREWFLPNRYVKTCENNEERGEFNGLDYMLLFNLSRIVYTY